MWSIQFEELNAMIRKSQTLICDQGLPVWKLSSKASERLAAEKRRYHALVNAQALQWKEHLHAQYLSFLDACTRELAQRGVLEQQAFQQEKAWREISDCVLDFSLLLHQHALIFFIFTCFICLLCSSSSASSSQYLGRLLCVWVSNIRRQQHLASERGFSWTSLLGFFKTRSSKHNSVHCGTHRTFLELERKLMLLWLLLLLPRLLCLLPLLPSLLFTPP